MPPPPLTLGVFYSVNSSLSTGSMGPEMFQPIIQSLEAASSQRSDGEQMGADSALNSTGSECASSHCSRTCKDQMMPTRRS